MQLFKVEEHQMITFQVIPDRTVDNRQNFKLIRALHEFYNAPIRRLSFGKWFVRYQPKARFWYDVVLTEQEIRFYFTVPKQWETYAKQKIEGCWPRASIEKVNPDDHKLYLELPEDNVAVSEMVYKRHNIFALRVDRTEDTQPLNAILQVSRDMRDGDVARLSICADPVNRLNWQDMCSKAHAQFAKGATPQRAGLSKRKAAASVGSALESLFNQFGDMMLAVLGHAEDNKPAQEVADLDKREILIDGRLGRATLDKRTEPTFNTRIRVASYSMDENRRNVTMRALSNSFVDVAGDNELEKVEVKKKKAIVRIVYELNNHRLKPGSVAELDNTVMSCSELGKLTQIPSAGLQDEYADQLDTIKLRQDGPPASLTGEGIPLCVVEMKTENVPVSLPVDEKDYDELCLPDVDIGGMGCGKTKGLAANMAVEAVLNGFGAVTIDPAKRELGQEIMAVLDEEQYIHVDLSKVKISLDWRESFHAARMSTRLANAVLDFFNMDGEELRTERFLFAAAAGMKEKRLSEILRIFEDDDYRNEVIASMPESINRKTLEEFSRYKPEMRANITAPIRNRMSIIFRSDYLSDCMEEANGLDFWELMQQRKAVIIDVPDDSFDPLEKDLIIGLISSKIDMAMRLRPEENQFPYFVILDEPHQYLKSTGLWTAAAVESRKFRVKYNWLFHSWEQIPNHLAEIIKAAGPHFHIYRSSEQTYRQLRYFLEPYTLEDVTKMPRFHAINIIRAGGETTRPFMAKMLPPPSMRYKLPQAGK